MNPSRLQRRTLAVLVCIACLLVPQVLVLGAAGRSPLLEGDAGSGPPDWSAPRTPARLNGIRWSDVPKDHWARNAIDHVGATNDWMRDFVPDADAAYPFKPDVLETRELFARSVVKALAPDAVPDPELTFPDLPVEDRFFTFANVAVASGWLEKDADGNFLPEDPVTTRDAHRTLVLALGMGDLAEGADALHLRNGTKIQVPKDLGTTLIGMKLGLRFNHSDESLDVGPDSVLSRAEVAWSLFRATTAPDWMRDWLAPYASVELPNLGPKMLRVVEFGLRYVGYPYVWGGEWADPTPSGYCCGDQPVGGFDCSGLTWWVMKEASLGWDNIPPREYRGWGLPQRGSAAMAAVAGRIHFDELRPGDLVFYDGDDDGTVDHVDTYIGNGWALDSGGSNAGVTITYIAGNWYEDHFVKGRRILG